MFGEIDSQNCSVTIVVIIVFAFSIINALIRATELVLAIISTCFMLIALFSGHSAAFQNYLSHESYLLLWRGPYPANFSKGQPPLLSSSSLLSSSGQDLDSSSSAQFRVTLHVWCGHLLLKIINLTYSALLIIATRKRSYSVGLAWVSFAIPVLLLSFLHFILDVLMGDFFVRPIQQQILQLFDICFQFVGILCLSCFLRVLYLRDEEIMEIDRYNNNIYIKRNDSFPQGAAGGIAITQIIPKKFESSSSDES